MVRRKGILFLLVVSLVVIAVPAFANHDKGDGQEACNYGEICLYDLKTSSRYTNQFWWGAIYGDDYTWYDTLHNHYHYGSNWLVDDRMSAVVNRDTVCDVRFYDWATGQTWTVPNVLYWFEAPDAMNDKADQHARVNC